MEPANTIIEKCGGFAATAKLADRSVHRVRLWTYSKKRGGTDGLIPNDCQHRLLTNARANGIDLRPEHFFPNDDVAGTAA